MLQAKKKNENISRAAQNLPSITRSTKPLHIYEYRFKTRTKNTI